MSAQTHDPAYFTQLLQTQRAFFAQGTTKPIAFRLAALRRMRDWIKAHEGDLLDALHADLHKAPFEAYGTEVGIVLDELRFALGRLKRWSRDRRVLPPLK